MTFDLIETAKEHTANHWHLCETCPLVITYENFCDYFIDDMFKEQHLRMFDRLSKERLLKLLLHGGYLGQVYGVDIIVAKDY